MSYYIKSKQLNKFLNIKNKPVQTQPILEPVIKLKLPLKNLQYQKIKPKPPKPTPPKPSTPTPQQ